MNANIASNNTNKIKTGNSLVFLLPAPVGFVFWSWTISEPMTLWAPLLGGSACATRKWDRQTNTNGLCIVKTATAVVSAWYGVEMEAKTVLVKGKGVCRGFASKIILLTKAFAASIAHLWPRAFAIPSIAVRSAPIFACYRVFDWTEDRKLLRGVKGEDK